MHASSSLQVLLLVPDLQAHQMNETFERSSYK